MKLFKKLFIKITIVILLIATTFSSRAGFISSFDYENVGSKIVTSANDITAYLGGIKDDLVHESLKQILAGITALKAGKIGAIINIFLTNTTSWRLGYNRRVLTGRRKWPNSTYFRCCCYNFRL
ncbi:MAG: hypothetical protein WKG06_40515 [Segetibacter sp.]